VNKGKEKGRHGQEFVRECARRRPRWLRSLSTA
jgi:hypothetical protein